MYPRSQKRDLGHPRLVVRFAKSKSENNRRSFDSSPSPSLSVRASLRMTKLNESENKNSAFATVEDLEVVALVWWEEGGDVAEALG